MYNVLPDVDYIAVVVEGSVDTMHRGAVKARVLGVTDEFDDDDQPYFYPALSGGLQQVPQPGYFLRVRLEDGDINRGFYYGISATPSYLPPEYSDSYPDVAVANLGEDGFFYTHNRQTHVTTIDNPGNNSSVLWDAAGFVTYDSTAAHPHAGMGAKEGGGSNTQHVLTEATIDIFTAMPVGGNRDTSGIGQGSEYLRVPHISQATIDAFNGQPPQDDTSKAPAISDTIDDSLQYNELVNASGEVVAKVPVELTDTMINRNGKVIKRILVCHTEGECFPVMASKIMTTGNTAHYLVGQVEGEPEIMGEGTDKDSLMNSGFYQFIDLDNDGGAYSGSTIYGKKANVDSVIVMLVGDAAHAPTPYQQEMLGIIVEHVRTVAGDDDIPVMSPNDFDIPSLKSAMPLFTTEVYNG